MLKAYGRKWFRKLFHRRVIVIILLLVQIISIMYFVISGSIVSQTISVVLTLLSLVVVLYIVSKKDKGAYKLTWVIQILLFPLFGGLMYLLFNFQTSTRKSSRRLAQIEKNTRPLFYAHDDGYDKAREQIPDVLTQIRYLQQFAGFPIYTNTSTNYLPSGEQKLEVLLEELKRAEHYIFLEYFIIQEGVMWNKILEILKQKAQEGVKVRVIYDDMGCFLLLPKDYPKILQSYGIECAVFNPFKPFLTVMQNNRDHRKIVVIDGKVAFTGGVNLADEYINVKVKHGHWKDAAIMVQGKAAWSFTLMFLQMWEFCKNVKEDYMIYYPWKDAECDVPDDGFVQPYADSPMDNENVGEHVYLQIINNAKDYVYIYTPYLIIDDSMISALTLAAKSGVDVRIVTPHKWDKWVIHMTTRSYYRELIKAGVKVYEYSKGFLHAKTFVSDDTTATVGTTNLDFRSLYLHFECGVWMHSSRAVMQVKDDFLQTLPGCQQITLKDCSTNMFMTLFQEVLRIFAPLM
ncbi:MAG: cardiolipin synthase [Lachnospira sp.]|nr:cardiolipin synthase [Lachnospira sp.]